MLLDQSDFKTITSQRDDFDLILIKNLLGRYESIYPLHILQVLDLVSVSLRQSHSKDFTSGSGARWQMVLPVPVREQGLLPCRPSSGFSLITMD